MKANEQSIACIGFQTRKRKLNLASIQRGHLGTRVLDRATEPQVRVS